ncbi:unannotated protein [freshwater metagenome]|uniref:Unannotated protein n=1 Tax=freshwater metagenome TaxID=449393 RepID=A0A6J7KGA5_9ZZZZ|nr:hypothetical protein [Actinomycetota bacterium]
MQHLIRLTHHQIRELLGVLAGAVLIALLVNASAAGAATTPTKTPAAPVSPALFQTPSWWQTADTAGPATTYRADDGTDRATVPTVDGGSRRLVRITSPSQPQTFGFPVHVPTGGKLTVTDDGGAIVTTQDGKVTSTIAPPFAVDATGAPVATEYQADGQTLKQIVKHRTAGTVLPVVADPFCRIWGNVRVFGRWIWATVGFEWRHRC